MSRNFLNELLFTIAVAGAAVAAPAPTSEKPVIPEDLYFEWKPVPVEDNAIINWRRAGEAEVQSDEKQRQEIKFCWTPSAREPSADVLDDLNIWVKRNQEALDMFNASLSKPKAQWPKRNPQKKQPELNALVLMIRARLFIADQLAEQRKFEASAGSLEGSLKLAQMGVEGDAALFNYIIACGARTMPQDAILRLAARKQVPLPVLERLLADLPEIDSETNTYSKNLRVEFTREYENVVDIKKLADDWSKIPETNAAFFLFPEECRHPFKVLIDPALVAMHPKPLDWNLEIEETAENFRVYRTNVFSAWSNRNDDVEADSVEAQTNFLEEIAPLMKLVENEPLPLSRAAAQKARSAYLAIENPIGRILDCSLSGFISSDVKVFHSRTEREATRAVLGLLIFERKKGVLPAKLSDLVDEKILPSVPGDLFSGGPLLYSRERRIVWSVGENGVDDGGKPGRVRWSGDDAVWQIPELN